MERSSAWAAACAAILVSLTLVAGCASSQESVVARGPSDASEHASVRIHNASDSAIFYLYVSPASERRWGPDLLQTHTVPVGSAFDLRDVPEGSWNIRVVDALRRERQFNDTYLASGMAYELVVDGSDWN